MKASILVVTYRRDFRYLVFALRSALKFAKGFEEIVVSCPKTDQRELETMIQDVSGFWPSTTPIRTRYFDEWPGKGMLHHMYVILHADCICPGADFVLHMDSDHVFTDKVTPATYIKEGKADLVYCRFVTLAGPESYRTRAENKVKEEPGVINWWSATYRALGVDDEYEFMRRAPIVHARPVYAQTRADISLHTGEPLEDYIRDQRNKYPQTFAEFQALGSVARRKFGEHYNWINQEEDPIPSGFVYQAWSHRIPTAEDLAKYKELGLGV